MGKIVKKGDYKPAPVNYTKNLKRKSCVQPNQSLTIGQILEKYSRGIPVDIEQKEGVYLNQTEFDYEKLNRQDFGEKHEFAQQMKRRAEAITADLEEQANARKEAAAKKKAEGEAAAKKGPGIDPLDNTMPGDTKQTTK